VRAAASLLLAGACAVVALVVPPSAGPAVAAARVPDPIPTPVGPAGTRTQKTLVVGLDGAMLDRILAADTPWLHQLVAEGTSSLTYRYAPATGRGLTRQARTVSGPGWSTMLTGTWPDRHGVVDNTFDGARFDAFPDFLTRAERLDPSVSTFAVADWDPLATSALGGPVISDAVDVRIGIRNDSDPWSMPQDDARSTDVAARYLAEGSPDLSFVYYGSTDQAGHAHGSASPQYAASLARDDEHVGRLLTAIRSRASYAAEDWTIIVTNDHGHTRAGGHGGDSLPERQEWMIAAGGGVPAGPQRDDLRVVDIAATALDRAGLPLDPALDGTPLRLVQPDAFDAVRPLLRTRRHDRGIPPSRVGSTHTPPPGWRVDNRRMGRGGMPEWRGWAFATDPFWTAAEQGQGREGFVRGRGVVAVADTDEWADRRHRGRFDSTLVTPALDVHGLGRAVLRFQGYYQQPGRRSTQRGRVTISFDGGPAQRVVTYRRTTSGPAVLPVAVPTGARTARVRFRCTGDDDWYWALDQVTLTPT